MLEWTTREMAANGIRKEMASIRNTAAMAGMISQQEISKLQQIAVSVVVVVNDPTV